MIWLIEKQTTIRILIAEFITIIIINIIVSIPKRYLH